MLIVNLYGAPGAGKSTGAAYVFSKLKMQGVNAELVTEFAKDKVWEESKAVFENQIYIFGEQYFRISRLKDKVDVVVTDSPILLSCFYGGEEQPAREELRTLVKEVHNSFENYNAFIERVKPYNPNGRFQNEQESDDISQYLKVFIKEFNVSPKSYNGDIEGYDRLVSDIIELLTKENGCA